MIDYSFMQRSRNRKKTHNIVINTCMHVCKTMFYSLFIFTPVFLNTNFFFHLSYFLGEYNINLLGPVQ